MRLRESTEKTAELPQVTVSTDRRTAFREEARNEWIALGPMGRTVLIALAMSAVVAVALAVVIPQQVERHLSTASAALLPESPMTSPLPG